MHMWQQVILNGSEETISPSTNDYKPALGEGLRGPSSRRCTRIRLWDPKMTSTIGGIILYMSIIFLLPTQLDDIKWYWSKGHGSIKIFLKKQDESHTFQPQMTTTNQMETGVTEEHHFQE